MTHSHAIRRMVRDMNAADALQHDIDHLAGVIAILFAGLCGVGPFVILWCLS